MYSRYIIYTLILSYYYYGRVYFRITFHLRQQIYIPTYIFWMCVCVRVRRHIRSYGGIDRRETTYVDVPCTVETSIYYVFGDRSSFARCKPPPLPWYHTGNRSPDAKGTWHSRYFGNFFFLSSIYPVIVPRHNLLTWCTHIYNIIYKCHKSRMLVP